MLGRSRVMTGQYAQAVTAYDKAIELTGGLDPGLRLDLAEALVLTNDAAGQARARQLVDEVLKSDPATRRHSGTRVSSRCATTMPRPLQQRFRSCSPRNHLARYAASSKRNLRRSRA